MKRTGFAPPSKAEERAAHRLRLANMKRAFKLAATRTGCVMCWATPVDRETRSRYRVQFNILQAHHVIPKRYVRGNDSRKWDTRNAMGLCQYHHMRHENHVERVPRALLTADVYEFAREHELEWLLDREYPCDASCSLPEGHVGACRWDARLGARGPKGPIV